MYYKKGFGKVSSKYHASFRAYEYRVRGFLFLSLGPGWAYNFEYLKATLLETYNYQYMPSAGDCVVDIGAGLGEETVIYAILVGKDGCVHALEANPRTFAGLKYMNEENKFFWVRTHNLAVYKSDGEVTIEDDERNYLTNTINAVDSRSLGILVKAKTLDTVVKENKIKRIDFLKSNIEGAEQFLIEGMDNSIQIIKNVCISCHDFRHKYHNHGEFYMTKEKIRVFLQKHGFEITIRNTGNRVVDDYIYARNTSI